MTREMTKVLEERSNVAIEDHTQFIENPNSSPLSWKHTTRIRFVERMPGITPEVTIGPIPE